MEVADAFQRMKIRFTMTVTVKCGLLNQCAPEDDLLSILK